MIGQLQLGQTAAHGVVVFHHDLFGDDAHIQQIAVEDLRGLDGDLLAAALQNAKEQGIALTDDCSAVEALGMPVQLTDGDEENLKITTPLDLELAALILRRRANA